MVCAGISVQGKTDLHTIENGTITADSYVNEVLDADIRPYVGAIGSDFIFVNDNAGAHMARVVPRNYRHRLYVLARSIPGPKSNQACL